MKFVSMRRFTCVAAAGVVMSASSFSDAQPISARVVISDTRVSEPIFVTAPRGDTTRLYVAEQVGPPSDPFTSTISVYSMPCYQYIGPFVSIPGVVSGGETGLLGMAFHPQYAANGKVYIYYTGIQNDGQTIEDRVVMFQRDPANPDRLLTPGTTILAVIDPEFGHNAGWMDFGPDGYLYVAIGDGGHMNDEGPGHIEPTGNAQNLTTPLGKILRLDVDGTNGPNGLYGIPPTNPFAQTSDPSVRKEIWAYGVRNPWRCDIDPLTGDLYIADVGQNDWEELNIQPADVNGSQGGRNYGWRCYEADMPFNSNGGTCAPFGQGNVEPLLKYGHFWFPPVEPVNRSGCSITGGLVYRGSEIPLLQGTYFFADFCFNWVYSIRADAASNTFTGGTDRTDELIKPTELSNIVSFGRDGAGEMYIVARGGISGPAVWKIVAAGSLPPLGCVCPGDFNNDRLRDTQDLIKLLSTFGNGVTLGTNGDTNGNGFVDTTDLTLLLVAFGRACP